MLEQLLKEERYDNMILLFGYFQNRTDGLRQKHFRYTLMDNANERLSFTRDMEDFFEGVDLAWWYSLGLIRKGSIATQKDLNYYLKYLLKNNVIEKVNRKKPFRYKLTPEFYSEYNKMLIREYIDRCDSDNNFDRNYFFEKHASSENIKHVFLDMEGKENWTMFGLPRKLDKMFTKDEINEITTRLKRVEENLWKIIELKYKKTRAIIEEQRIIDIRELASIDFFYHGIRKPEKKD